MLRTLKAKVTPTPLLEAFHLPSGSFSCLYSGSFLIDEESPTPTLLLHLDPVTFSVHLLKLKIETPNPAAEKFAFVFS